MGYPRRSDMITMPRKLGTYNFLFFGFAFSYILLGATIFFNNTKGSDFSPPTVVTTKNMRSQVFLSISWKCAR